MLISNKSELKSMVGKRLYVLTRQGQMVEGILQKIDDHKIYLNVYKPNKGKKGRKAATKGFFRGFNPIITLVLFDLLAIGTSPFAFGSPFSPFFFI